MSQKVMNRNLVVVGAVMIQLALGAIYAWSVFTPYLVPQGLKKNDKGGYTQVVVFSEVKLPGDETVRVGKAIPKEPKAKDDEQVVEAEAMVSVEGDVPPGYPYEQSELKTATVKVVIPKEVSVEDAVDEALAEATAAALAPSRAEISAAKAGWTKTQANVVFSTGLALFAIVMVVAGRKMAAWGSRNLALAGGVVLGVGYILAGVLGGTNFWVTLICVGGLGGVGIGLAYVVPIAIGMRWFPDKKGLITGLAVAGFGFGAVLWVKLAGPWAGLLANQGLDMTFIIYGVVFLVTVCVGALWMVSPPEGWKPEGWAPPQASTATGSAGTVDLVGSQLLATPQFYMIFLTFLLGASAGLMSIGLMKLFPMEALCAGDKMTAAVASVIAGTAMAIYSVTNGLGRIAWGAISERLGRKTSIMLMMAIQGVVVILFQWMAGQEYTLYLGAALIGFNFGGNFALFPLITADTFGAKHVGQNYGLVFLAYGVGGIFGPILGGMLGDMGRFPVAFTICGVLCIVAAVIISAVRPPKSAAA